MAVQIGSVEVITSAEAALALEPEWDALAMAHGRTPFALPALALSWWRHLGRGELLVVAVRGRTGELLAVGPFHRRSLGGVGVARWLGTGLGSVAELVRRPDAVEAADAVWATLVEHVQVLDLAECRDDGVGLIQLRRSTQWVSELRIVDLCPVLDLSGVECVDALLVGRSIRKKLNRAERALSAAGSTFTVEVVADPSSLHGVLADLTGVYDEAERANPRQHLLADPWRAFVVDGLTSAAERGQLVVFVGRVDDRVVAFDIALRIGHTVSNWIGRYRPEVAELSVGHLMCREIIRWALANEVATIDLLVGDQEYKRRWSNGHYDTVDVEAGRPGWGVAARTLVRAAKAAYPMKSAVQDRVRAARQRGDPWEPGARC